MLNEIWPLLFSLCHDDVIKWKHFPRYWPFVRAIPSQRPVTRSFDVFFDLRLNKRLSKQSRRRWFETPLRSLWRHCNVIPLRHGITLDRKPLTFTYDTPGIRNQEIFIFNTTKAFGQVNSTCLQKIYSIFKESKQYITIIRSKKNKTKYI